MDFEVVKFGLVFNLYFYVHAFFGYGSCLGYVIVI